MPSKNTILQALYRIFYDVVIKTDALVTPELVRGVDICLFSGENNAESNAIRECFCICSATDCDRCGVEVCMLFVNLCERRYKMTVARYIKRSFVNAEFNGKPLLCYRFSDIFYNLVAVCSKRVTDVV